MKKYLIITILLFGCIATRAQTLAFGDMVDLVTLSLPQVDNILVQTGKFKINDKEDQFGQIITHYQTIDKNKSPVKGESMITGSYRTSGDGIKLKTITYQTIYPAYIDNLIKQIKRFGYRVTFTGRDMKGEVMIFDNALNHITVTKLADHSNNSIVIRQKDIGIEP